ncbi:MAG: aminotransferase class I/II-fold pyridoxal phosphate-dependent enzyme [Gammaproteobacteria bacterium]
MKIIHANFRNNWFRKKVEQAREHQEKAYHEVNELVIEEREGKQIVLTDGTRLTEFISCSYLGLDMDERLIAGATSSIQKCGVTFAAARTRARVKSFVVLEELLNKIFCDNYTVVFGSLHLAHLGFFPLLASGEMPSFPLKENGVVFILDKTVHASIQINRGLLSQFGEVVLENFQQLDDLEKIAQRAAAHDRTPVFISDSVGSMGGIVSIEAIAALAERYKGYAYLDDAHGMSIHGENGCGYVLKCLQHKLPPRVIISTSLAKAFGAVAGVLVLPTRADMEMVKRFATTYVFGGPPPLTIIDSAIASAKIHLSPEIKVFQNRLWDNVQYFDELFGTFGDRLVNNKKPSPVRGVLIGDEFKAIACALQLRKAGFLVTTAMYPTVAKGRSMLRAAISASHSKEDINKLYAAFNEALKSVALEKAVGM